MMTWRPGGWVCGALVLSTTLWQCDSYDYSGLQPPDLSRYGVQGGSDLARVPTPPDLLNFPAPTITTMAPALGPNTGGTALTITGTGFLSGATVSLDGTACDNVQVVSSTSLTCTTPAVAATCGPVPVQVTNPDQQSATRSDFSYASKTFALAAGTSIPNGAISRGAVWADFNADGKNDLANLNAVGALTINVRLGTGDGTFGASKTATLGTGQVPSALAVGDLDNNGAPDLVAILTGAAGVFQVLVLLGQKDGTFKPHAGGAVALTKNSAPTAVAVATADNKAKPYVVVSGTVGGLGTIDVLQNDGTGLLSMLVNKPVGGTGASHLVLADVNNDGKLDAITANSASGNVSVLTGNGAGTFTAVTGSPLIMGVAPNHVATADLDHDGKLDLITSNTGVAAATVGLNIRKGDGLGGFGAAPFFTLLAQAPTSLATADFNLDGNPDVAVSQATAQFSYLTGKGTIGAATFNAPVAVTVSTLANSILAAPFHINSDGLYDVVTTSSNTTANNLSISLNKCQ